MAVFKLADIGVPDRLLPAFRSIYEMDEAGFRHIESALDGVQIGILPDDFEGHLESRLEGEYFPLLAGMIYNFGNLINNTKESNVEVAARLSESFFEKAKIDVSEAEVEAFSKRIEDLLNKSQPISDTYNLFELILESERTYEEGRIISDIRPIFSKDKELGVQYASVIHNYRIDFTEKTEKKRIVLALTYPDLIEMRTLIERAIAKEDVLREMIAKSGVDYVAVKNPER